MARTTASPPKKKTTKKKVGRNAKAQSSPPDKKSPQAAASKKPEADRQKIRDVMTPALQGVADKVLTLVQKSDTAVLQSYYKVGQHVAMVVDDPATYSPSGVDYLAQYVGLHRKTLAKWANLTRVYSYDQISSAKNKRNSSIGSEYFIVLAQVDDKRKRDSFYKQVVEGQISSVEALESAVQMTKVADGRRGRAGAKPTLPSSPAQGLAQMRRLATTVQNQITMFSDHVLGQIENAEDDEISTEQCELLSETNDYWVELQNNVEALTTRLAAVTARYKAVLDPESVEAPVAKSRKPAAKKAIKKAPVVDDDGDDAFAAMGEAPSEDEDVSENGHAAPKRRKVAPKK
jgi:hypothetical protein